MQKDLQDNSSELYLVRLWVQKADGEDARWQGRLVHVLSGQAHDFQDWHTLQALLLEKMRSQRANSDFARDQENDRISQGGQSHG